MSTTPNRVFLARLVGLPVFDPLGDQVAKVRDVVVALRSDTTQPRVLGESRVTLVCSTRIARTCTQR